MDANSDSRHPWEPPPPTQEEIARATAEIRRTWTRREYLMRSGFTANGAREAARWSAPVVATADLEPQTRDFLATME